MWYLVSPKTCISKDNNPCPKKIINNIVLLLQIIERFLIVPLEIEISSKNDTFKMNNNAATLKASSLCKWYEMYGELEINCIEASPMHFMNGYSRFK